MIRPEPACALACQGGGMDVLLPFSQTDQEGSGQVVAILNGRSLLPVQAVQDWIAEAGITCGPLFRPINQAGGLGRKPLGHWTIAAIIKYYAGLAGLDVAEFTGHSPRERGLSPVPPSATLT